MLTNEVKVKRLFGRIGWIGQMNFIDIETEKPIALKSYGGRMCFQIGKERIGYKTFQKKSKQCNITIINNTPF